MARLSDKPKPKARGRKTTVELLEQLRLASQLKKKKSHQDTPRAQTKRPALAHQNRDERDRMAMQHIAEVRRDEMRKLQAELNVMKRRPKKK